jgi:hypothetical protein
MLLKIYLITTIISWIVTAIFAVASENRSKRKGYKFRKVKKSFAENLASNISNIFMASIPVYNIINTACIMIMGDKLFDKMEKELLKKGVIYMPEEVKEEKNEFAGINIADVNSDKSDKIEYKYIPDNEIRYAKERELFFDNALKNTHSNHTLSHKKSNNLR